MFHVSPVFGGYGWRLSLPVANLAGAPLKYYHLITNFGRVFDDFTDLCL